jgi:putative redox protein
VSATIPVAVQIVWAGEGRFDAGREATSREGGPDESPQIRLDSSAHTGPSPFDALLCALGSCAAVDVVDILAKRRTPVESLRVNVRAERVDGTPRRLARATLEFSITGAGIERVHAERAIDLAVNKYCSVRDSLRPDAPIDGSLTLAGERRESREPGAAT